jgi:hypothetical protein
MNWWDFEWETVGNHLKFVEWLKVEPNLLLNLLLSSELLRSLRSLEKHKKARRSLKTLRVA